MVVEVDKLERLRSMVRELRRVVVACSGGVDSSLLAVIAHEELGESALAVTAASPALPAGELSEVAIMAAEWGLRWQVVETAELGRPGYVRNGPDRCYHCRGELFDVLAPIAAREGAVVAVGTIVDDLSDHRPGQQAAKERGVHTPLADAGFTKRDVRDAARALGLSAWDKPAAACLASRIPYGTPVTISTLRRVERAEAGLRAIGYGELRVRHYGDVARLEVPLERLGDVITARRRVVSILHQAGYRYATLDLEGLRSGNLNRAIGEGDR